MSANPSVKEFYKHLPAIAPILYEGDTGAAVVALQQLLNVLNHQLVIDGFFGAVTLRSVIAFQHEMGLEPDGVVDIHTWAELRRHAL